MTAEEKLQVLKSDLQLITNANDALLSDLLELAARLITREGITLTEGDIECDMLVVQYAAYLFRRRAAGQTDTVMPRFLRWQLNNLLFSQKGRVETD